MTDLSTDEIFVLRTLKALRDAENAYYAKFRIENGKPIVSLLTTADESIGDDPGDEYFADIQTEEHLRIIEATRQEWLTKGREQFKATGIRPFNSYDIPFVAAARIIGEEGAGLDSDLPANVSFEPTATFVLPDDVKAPEIDTPLELDTGKALLITLDITRTLDFDDGHMFWRWIDTKYNFDTDVSEDVPSQFIVSADCSDFFEWGTADSEPITLDTLAELISAHNRVQQLLPETSRDKIAAWTMRLYCAYIRKIRPQGAYFRFIPEELQADFRDIGEERTIDILNPYPA